jgi:iron complex outermembrane receptor protein
MRTLIALAVASAFPLHAAMAQEAKPAEAAKAETGQLETVIVTAQRRAENIKDVPMAITTLKGEKLDVLTSGGQDIRFLSARSPSLNVESDYGRSFPRFYIRGLGNTDFDLNASQPVGLIYDDIVLESPMLKGFPVFDVDQVEVLRGPQGTLFGRNSPAGVIKFDSTKPTFKQEGYINAGVGNYGAWNVEGALNIPANDTFATRISLQSQHRNDRVHNPNPNGTTRDFEGYADTAVRLQFLAKPTKDISALLNIHGRDMHGNAMLFRANIMKKGTNELVDGFDYGSYPTDGGNSQTLSEFGSNLRLRWDLPSVTLHSITGYETVDFFSRGDVDGGIGCGFCGMATSPGFIPFPVETADLLPAHKQFSQEFRIESNTKDALQWIAGMYYFNEDMRIDSIAYDSLTKGSPKVPAYSTQSQKSEAWAAFGSINYAVDAKLKLRAGLRYTNDDKKFHAERYDPAATPWYSGMLNVNKESSNVSWDVSANYELDKQTNVFGRIATGYRAPSIQGRLFGTLDKPSSASAEKAISFEAGFKSDLFNRRARLSGTVFQYRVSDKQLTAGTGSINMNQLINADKVIGQGLELDFQANLSDALRATFGASYNDTEIKDSKLFVQTCGNAANNAATGCTVTDTPGPFAGTAYINGNPLPRAPKVSYNFTLRYSAPVADGEFFALTDWAYRGSYNMFLYTAKEYNAKSLLEGGLRVGYKWADGKYELAAFGRNITNKIQTTAAIDFDNLTGMVTEPRIYGLQFKANF